ncbi:DUF7519 family protein [Salinirubrum litoreum]|uniref:Uncharacterized protein n=1 Tax=Salinirubrum litoreum TaxID=1126234 RepID=A0ABD5R995_9EURY|nr:hypothetical protein [Salinirubrum litoreum]
MTTTDAARGSAEETATTDEGPDPELPNAPTHVGGRLAVAVAVVAGVVLGWAVGAPLAVSGSALGGLLLGVAVADVETGGNAATVRGGLFGLLGSGLLVGGAVAAGGSAALVGAAVGLAVATSAVDASVGFDTEATGSLTRSFWWSGLALVGGVLVLAGVTTGTVLAVARFGADSLAWLVALNELTALLLVQVFALAFGVATAMALPVVERYAPESVARGTEPLETLALDVWAVPRGYWTALGLQAVLAAYAPETFAWVLSVVPVVGDAVRFLLQSGVLHVPLVVGTLAAGTVALAGPTIGSVRSVAGPDPAETVSLAGAGLLVTLFVGVPLAIPPVARAVTTRLPPGQLRASTELLGPSVMVLGGLTVAVTGAMLALGGVLFASAAPGLSARARGFTLAAVTLFAAALGVGALGGTPLVVVLGVAGAMLVWDFGDHATGLGLSVGRDGETRDAELVHLTGSTLVAGAGVAVALVAVYLLGPVGGFSSVGDWRATLALTLTLVSLLALVRLLE